MKQNRSFSYQTKPRMVTTPNHLMAEMHESNRSEAKVWLLLALCAWVVLALSLWVKP